MDGMEMLMAGMTGGRGGNTSELKPIAVSDLDKGFDPIPNLKPGEKVRAKSEKYNMYKTASDGAVLTVHRVGEIAKSNSDSSEYQNDFTALFASPERIVEFAFDSRRFERVE